MLPVKPSNQQRNTRANSRRNHHQKQNKKHSYDSQPNPSINSSNTNNNNINMQNGAIHQKPTKSRNNSKKSQVKSKSKTKYNFDDEQTYEQQINEATVNTGLANRKYIQSLDAKTTVKKISFQSKPIIKDLMKRLVNCSKQYAPEYFVQILEYAIEKESRNSLTITVDKIQKWRVFIERQRIIQEQVKKQVKKMAKRIITGRKKFNKSIQYDYYIQKQTQSQPPHDFNPKNNNNKYYPQLGDSTSSQQCSSSIENASMPQSLYINPQSLLPKQEPLTEQKLSKQWQLRYQVFTCFIQTIYQLLGQHQCNNTIFPACYIFYTMLVSDLRVFNYLVDVSQGKVSKQESEENFDGQGLMWLRGQKNWHTKQPTLKNMIEYYLIVSILIATKYHEIYPVSILDMIDCINPYLSFDRAIKIQGQILQMFNFNEFFNETENKYLNMFGIVIGWSMNQMNVCQFILQSGLNNPKLYTYSPLFKAAVVIGLYQQNFMKTQQKFMMIRGLCPGLTLDLTNKIKKQYLQVLIYNHRSMLIAQKKKFYILDNQMRTLLRQNI